MIAMNTKNVIKNGVTKKKGFSFRINTDLIIFALIIIRSD